jgi:UDP-2,3-diacylglucosamine pyrophosphatase LpxH
MWFFSFLRAQNIKNIICLGDLYDRKKYLNFVTADRCAVDFLEIVNKEFQMDIILGNHDIYHKNRHDINSLDNQITGRYSNINVISSPITKTYDGTDILLLPWITDSNKDASIKAIDKTKAQIVMGHLELDGFEMDKGTFKHGGQDPNDFKKFEIVCSGHFHHKSSKNNIHYLGAAYEFNWSDWNDPRGFTIFDTKKRTLEFIQIPYNMFYMLMYDDSAQENEIKDFIKNTDISYLKDKYVRLVVVKKNNPYLFDMYVDKFYKVSPQDLSIVESSTLFDDGEEIQDISQSENTMTILNKYVDGLKMDEDASKIKEMLREIYLEAISAKENQDA